ncbi:hypothetical protein T265_01157 [Opisthorchis viverrini]|uniref:BHLH domain-containing protein n=1 Tax=Opisthorchis viverrini TaxID=6198 RepID=A0A075A0I2_OPIVI|nr:hypothetical protein T265_01157 [Opisthorchis viverrini]KER32871.1 hypothetical protein T265_01157 [Opisthorchis viverrini]
MATQMCCTMKNESSYTEYKITNLNGFRQTVTALVTLAHRVTSWSVPLMDVLDSLSDIFDDPLLNEFTEKLLSDIDLTELNGISCDISQSQDDGVIDVSESEYKIESDGESRWDCSNSTTLEALLKSRNPVSCVPPAPDLCSDLTKASPNVTHLKVRDISNLNLSSNHRRNSLPTLKSDPEKPLLPKDGVSGVKPRLIRDYLEKCETEDPLSKHPRRYFIDGAESPYDRSKSADKNNRRAPHNAIEKRYRASINGRIDELRKILIPYPTSDAKMNKSAVLRQAIDRIRELQEMNERLQAEVLTLRSLHSCGRLHNGSPESGIVSFEPSPSSSTNISSLDFGGFTSPPLSSDTSCGSSYHNGMSVTSRTISNEHPMTLLDALDAKQNNWPIDGEISPQLVDASDVRSLGNTQCSEVSFDDGVDLVTSAEAHQMFVFSPSYGPADFPSTVGQDHASYRHLSAPSERNPHSINSTASLASHARNGHDRSAHLVNVYHGKRLLCPVQSGPVKVRRQTLLAPSANNSQRPSGLIIPCASQLSSKLSDTSTSPPNPKALPVVRQLLCSPPVNVPPTTNALSSQMVESTAHYVHGQTSGFNGVAARTTLCVAALCLITVDLTTLSGSGSHATDSAKDNPNEFQIECAVPESLEWTELITCCVQDFVDTSVEMLKHARKQSDHSLLRTEPLAKSGFILAIALNRGCAFPRFITVLVFEPSKDCSKLEPYIKVLLQFNAAKSSSLGRVETAIAASTPQDADSKDVWWAKFIHAAWYNRARCATLPTQMSESNTTYASPILERPPQDVLKCPHTGTLAESAWLTYCSLQRLQHTGTSSFTRDSISGCQRAAMLLRKCLQQLSELNSSHGAPDQSVTDVSENMNPPLFWMLACELLVADWQLSFLAAALMPSQRNLLEETVAQSATSKQTLSAFNTALWVMLQASSLLSATTPEWITKKLSYSETINRLLSGANPVHSRLVLMHACQNSPIMTNANIRSRIFESTFSTRGSEQPYLLSNSSSPAVATVGGITTPAPSVSNSMLLDFDPVTLKNTLSCVRPSRCSILTQSPGQ